MFEGVMPFAGFHGIERDGDGESVWTEGRFAMQRTSDANHLVLNLCYNGPQGSIKLLGGDRVVSSVPLAKGWQNQTVDVSGIESDELSFAIDPVPPVPGDPRQLGIRIRNARLCADPKAMVFQKHELDGMQLELADYPGSQAAAIIVDELRRGDYRITEIPFKPGDAAIDIGAHIGIVSIYLAKKFPFLTIYSYEPVPDNFRNLQANLARNHVTNVRAFNKAVTGDGRDLEMCVHFGSNSGGATGSLKNLNLEGHERFRVPSTTLDQIFADHKIGHCRLLKIDCEGAEHEVLLASGRLGHVDYVRGEFHINGNLESRGHSIDKLIAHCASFMPKGHVVVTPCRMAE